MIDRRKLIRLALSNLHGETPFVDFKESIDLSGERGRGQFVKAVCALANSNPTTSSYLIVGVTDDRVVRGSDFLDDQKVQPILARYLFPAPKAIYENVCWPDRHGTTFVGVLRIAPSPMPVQISRDLWKLKAGTHYLRRGSESIEAPPSSFIRNPQHASELLNWERSASTSLATTIASFSGFQASFGSYPIFEHRIYHDLNVVCWSGQSCEEGSDFIGELSVLLLPAEVTLFWSCLRPMQIEADDSSIVITEYVGLWWKGEKFVAPFEQTRFAFGVDGTYSERVTCILQVPATPKCEVEQLVARCRDMTVKAQRREPQGSDFWRDAEIAPYELAVAALNGADEARITLEQFLGDEVDGYLAESKQQALRIMQRVMRRS